MRGAPRAGPHKPGILATTPTPHGIDGDTILAMSVGHHLDAAIAIALTKSGDVHERWINVMLLLGARFGVANLRMAHDTRIDMLLRQMEAEFIDTEQSDAGLFRFDMQVALSEQWILSSYEILRSCCQVARERQTPDPKLKALRDTFSMVRTPLAKYEIDKTNRDKPNIWLHPVEMVEGADNSPKQYDTDGSYIIPKGVCPETGAIVWYPIDIRKKATIAICRRDLSNAMLGLFD